MGNANLSQTFEHARLPFIAELVEHARLAPKHVLIRRFRLAEQTQGGIVRPENVRERQQQRSPLGMILLVGPDSTWRRDEIVLVHPNGGQDAVAADAIESEVTVYLDEEVVMALPVELVAKLAAPESEGERTTLAVVESDEGA